MPSGCSTALVMNRRPGHAPQLPPLAVEALAGRAAAPAGRAIAASAVRPSATLTNVIRRNLVIFSGVLFLRRGRQPGRRPTAAPLFRLPLLASAAARVLGPPGAHARARQDPPPPGASETRRAGSPKSRRCCRPRARRHAGRNAPAHRQGTSPAGLVDSQQRGRRIPRQREAGQDQARGDQDPQDSSASADVALTCVIGPE